MTAKLRVVPYVLLLLPLDLAVVVAMLLAQLCVFVSLCLCVLKTKTQRHKDTKTERLDPAVTVIIVSWDGKHLLAECLPSVIESIKCAGGSHQILVVDNGSTDGSAQYIHDNFP